jgi:hypothetical protein
MNLTGAMLAGLRLLTTIRGLGPMSLEWRAPADPAPATARSGSTSRQ